jgi:glycosyltransferase involved in cell wall biosynthesis
MNISIIIPTVFNRPSLMDDLLESIFRQSGVKYMYEVVLVDNNAEAKDGLAQIAAKWSRSLPVRLIHVPQNGLHNARHAGAKAASGSILIYVDDDVRTLPGWLSAYEDFFVRTGEYCAGGKVLPEWETTPADWIAALSPNIFSLLDYGDEARVLKSKEGINGCNFAVKKDVLFEFGGFHPDGFSDHSKRWYRGDGEYGLIQAIQRGGKDIHYLPEATVYHRIPKRRMELDSIRTIIQNHAISHAYLFARRNNCSLFSILALIVGGKLVGFQKRLEFAIQNRSVRNEIPLLLSLKYATIAQYGLRLLQDRKLREYIQRASYLVDSEPPD